MVEFHRQIRAFPPERSGGWPKTQVLKGVPENGKNNLRYKTVNNENLKLLGDQVAGRMKFELFLYSTKGSIGLVRKRHWTKLIAFPKCSTTPEISPGCGPSLFVGSS